MWSITQTTPQHQASIWNLEHFFYPYQPSLPSIHTLSSFLPLSRGRLMEYPITHCSERGMFEVGWVCVCVGICVCTLSWQDIGADIWEINTSISLCLWHSIHGQGETEPPLSLEEENKREWGRKKRERWGALMTIDLWVWPGSRLLMRA